MRKTGHILVTKNAIPLTMKHPGWVLFGSIAPDLLLHTFIKGHTYQATSTKIFHKMEYLKEHGTTNRRYCFMLGYLLHYVEDYFTYPHNSTYPQDTLYQRTWLHTRYEKQQYDTLRKKQSDRRKQQREQESSRGKTPFRERTLPGDVELWIKDIHQTYLAQDMGIENDISYIQTAADTTMQYFAYEFRRNESAARIEKMIFKENVYEI